MPTDGLVCLLLSIAALVANKFYEAMTQTDFNSFFKSKTQIGIFFDIHEEYSCLLPRNRDVGMREEMILQSSQLSPQLLKKCG